jgi:hypothetical protein
VPVQSYESFALPVESMEHDPAEEGAEKIRLRREQSQLAAQLIGQRLLQGWTLLDDVCPNATCYGVGVDSYIYSFQVLIQPSIKLNNATNGLT